MVEIKDGGFYRTRDGEKLGPAARNEPIPGYPWWLPSVDKTKKLGGSYTDAGEYYGPSSPHPRDIVAEWQDAAEPNAPEEPEPVIITNTPRPSDLPGSRERSSSPDAAKTVPLTLADVANRLARLETESAGRIVELEAKIGTVRDELKAAGHTYEGEPLGVLVFLALDEERKKRERAESKLAAVRAALAE